MRLVGILLALLSAATLLHALVPRTSYVPAVKVPKYVNFRIQVFEGTNFKKLPKYRQKVQNVFDEARRLFRIFTDSYYTTFTFTTLFSYKWDDTSISFNGLEKKSGESKVKNVNLYVYFANNNGYRGVFRNGGLRGKVCDANKGYRTLLLNQYDGKGRKQNAKVLAKMMVYYLAYLLGMGLDEGTCPRGLMSSSNWRLPTWKRTWNVCNLRDLANGYKTVKALRKTAAFMWCPVYLFEGNRNTKKIKARRVPIFPRLSIKLAPFANYDDYAQLQTIYEVRHKAQAFLNQGPFKLGVKFELQYIGPVERRPGFQADTHNIATTLERAKGVVDGYRNSKKPYTSFFLFFTEQGLDNLPQQAHEDMFDKFCDADIKYRTFIFDRKNWGSAVGQFSVDGIAKQLAYFIARSIGLRDDWGLTSCPNGFMHTKGLRAGITRKEFIDNWNRESAGITWNKCGIQDMTSAIEKKQCLKRKLNWE